MRTMFAAAVCALLVLGTEAAPQKVKLTMYAEALCPFCVGAIGGPVNKTLVAKGITDILDFEYVPFGNAGLQTKECGKDRHCWYHKCEVANPPSWCWEPTGPAVCQHGPDECYGNNVDACAKHLSTGYEQYMTFVYCFEYRHYANSSSVDSCAAAAGLSGGAIAKCLKDESLMTTLTVQAAKKTAAVHPPGVPDLFLNGKSLDDIDTLLAQVCAAWTGEKPAGCPSVQKCLRD